MKESERLALEWKILIQSHELGFLRNEGKWTKATLDAYIDKCHEEMVEHEAKQIAALEKETA